LKRSIIYFQFAQHIVVKGRILFENPQGKKFFEKN